MDIGGVPMHGRKGDGGDGADKEVGGLFWRVHFGDGEV